jgi:hypothetical protein
MRIVSRYSAPTATANHNPEPPICGRMRRSIGEPWHPDHDRGRRGDAVNRATSLSVLTGQ